MFLLDTMVVSETRKFGTRYAHPKVKAWVTTIAEVDSYISVLSILEIEIGVLRLKRYDAAQARVLETWLEGVVLKNYAGRILEIDLPVVRRCALSTASASKPSTDALIAATAWVHGLSVATRNVKDFANMGVQIVDPFE